MAKSKPWEDHYKRKKSVLLYPDENLVRMLKAYLADKDMETLSAIDLGCGTGRHLKLLNEIGIRFILGADNSINALNVCKELYNLPFIQSNNTNLSFLTSSFDIAISWGTLHYCTKDILEKQIDEIYRIIKKGGRLFGTLRSEQDTYLKKGKDLGNGTWATDLYDIKNTIVSFYSEKELQAILSRFSSFQYGLMERTIIGAMEKKISHWFFWADK